MRKIATKNLIAKLLVCVSTVASLTAPFALAGRPYLTSFYDDFRTDGNTFSRYYAITTEAVDLGLFPEQGRYRMVQLKRKQYTETTLRETGVEAIERRVEYYTYEVDCTGQRINDLRHTVYRDWDTATAFMETHTGYGWMSVKNTAPDSTAMSVWNHGCAKLTKEAREASWTWGEIVDAFERGNHDSPWIKQAAKDPANKLKLDALRLMYP